MRIGVNAIHVFNGTAGIAQLCGFPAPKVPNCLKDSAERYVDKVSMKSNVGHCKAVQKQLDQSSGEENAKPREIMGLRGEDLRSFQNLLLEKDPQRNFCGLRRVCDKSGRMIWTTDAGKDVLEKEFGEHGNDPGAKPEFNDGPGLPAEGQGLPAGLPAGQTSGPPMGRSLSTDNPMHETTSKRRTTSSQQDLVKRKSTVSKQLRNVLTELDLDNFERIFAKEGIRDLQDFAPYDDNDLTKLGLTKAEIRRLRKKLKRCIVM